MHTLSRLWATMTCVSFEPKVYLAKGNVYSFSPSTIHIYTLAEQRDNDAAALDLDVFTPGMAVNSGVH